MFIPDSRVYSIIQCSKIDHHPNLSTRTDSTISDQTTYKTAKIHCFTVLDQVFVLDFQLGPDLKDEKFLGFYILD